VKYGPQVLADSPAGAPSTPPSAPTDAGTPIAGEAGTPTEPLPGDEGEVEVEGELPEIEGRKLGPELEPSSSTADAIAAANRDLERQKLTIRELNRQATNKQTDKTVQKAAQVALADIATQEYGRADGGRDPIKRILARYGYANPNKKK
jgi:hypothetical protein